jgi:hypothetical protein
MVYITLPPVILKVYPLLLDKKMERNEKTHRKTCEFCGVEQVSTRMYAHYSSKHFFDFWTESNENRLKMCIKKAREGGAIKDCLVDLPKEKSLFFCPTNGSIYVKRANYDTAMKGVQAPEYCRYAEAILMKISKRPKVEPKAVIEGLGANEIKLIQKLTYSLVLEINDLRQRVGHYEKMLLQDVDEDKQEEIKEDMEWYTEFGNYEKYNIQEEQGHITKKLNIPFDTLSLRCAIGNKDALAERYRLEAKAKAKETSSSNVVEIKETTPLTLPAPKTPQDPTLMPPQAPKIAQGSSLTPPEIIHKTTLPPPINQQDKPKKQPKRCDKEIDAIHTFKPPVTPDDDD